MLISKVIKHPWVLPLLIFHLIVGAVVVKNFPTNSFFIGWDAINPELNFPLNFHRALFPSWQENYGVGTATAHGFGGLFLHTIVIFLLSLVAPVFSLRSTFTFLCLYLGGLGIFFLSSFLLKEVKGFSELEKKATLPGWLSLCSALFYVLNIGTLQIFAVQLEAFIVQFASLPWLFLTLFKALKKPTLKTWFYFFLVSFLSSIQGFIPPLFLTYGAALGIFLTSYLLWFSDRFTSKLKLCLTAGLLTVLANAHWLATFSYYTLANRAQYLASYTNLLSTPEFSARNRAYGDVADVSLLRSFFWDSHQFGSYLFEAWHHHFSTQWPIWIGYSFFGLVLVGVLSSLRNKSWPIRAILLSTLFFFCNLATNTPPFKFLIEWLYQVSPAYAQAFRITFTKFGIGLSFFYSVLLVFGLAVVVTKLPSFLKKLKVSFLVPLVAISSLIAYAWPSFSGQFLYRQLKVQLPESYLEVMRFLNTQPNQRIADLPVSCSEGWYSYSWGYLGSGFYWYGVEQPIMARSFDVWNPSNEQYYWEVSQAINQGDYELVDQIFQKYDVSLILADPNVIHCKHEQALAPNRQLIEHLKNSSNYSLLKTFSTASTQDITLFKRTSAASSNFLSGVSNPSRVTVEPGFKGKDPAYLSLGNYISDPEKLSAQVFPFSSLFTKRSSQELSATISQTPTHLTVTKETVVSEQSRMKIPAYASLESLVPVELEITATSPSSARLVARYVLPMITQQGKVLFDADATFELGTFATTNPAELELFTNRTNAELRNGKHLGSFFTTEPNEVWVVTPQGEIIFEWLSDGTNNNQQLLTQEFNLETDHALSELTVTIPKVFEARTHGYYKFNTSSIVPTSCGVEKTPPRYELNPSEEYLRLIAEHNTLCLPVYFSELLTGQSYVLSINHRHVQGTNLKLSLNDAERITNVEVLLGDHTEFAKELLIAPNLKASDQGLVVLLQNVSFDEQPSINDINDLEVFYFPQNWLTSLSVTPTDQPTSEGEIELTNSTRHNETLYRTRVRASGAAYLTISQGYHPGWLAFKVPTNTQSLSQYQPLHHVLYNGWANAWEVPAGEFDIIVFYWPQLLAFAGYGVLFGTFIFFAVLGVRHRVTQATKAGSNSHHAPHSSSKYKELTRRKLIGDSTDR